MPHGKTDEMIMLSRMFEYVYKGPREPRERDRALAGKKRIKARKAANKVRKAEARG
jgi:hypothetical protein